MSRSVGRRTGRARALARPRADRALAHAIAPRITHRDRQICLDLNEHRVLTIHQIHQLHFSSYSRARARMCQLYRMRVVDRFQPHRSLGSAPMHYVLDEIGAGIVAAYKAIERKKLRYSLEKALSLIHSPRLAHMIEVNEFFTRLAHACRDRDRTKLLQWWGESRCSAYWKGLIHPDGLGSLDGTGSPLSFFLELDRATENRKRLEEKLERYAHIAAMPGSPDLVLFCFPSSERERNAREVLIDCGIRIATGVLGSHLADPLGANWLPLGSERRYGLVELRKAIHA